jgi:hypothetical protein
MKRSEYIKHLLGVVIGSVVALSLLGKAADAKMMFRKTNGTLVDVDNIQDSRYVAVFTYFT